jgi:hypothetical protein
MVTQALHYACLGPGPFVHIFWSFGITHNPIKAGWDQSARTFFIRVLVLFNPIKGGGGLKVPAPILFAF